jgi:hypothetical protein
MSDAADKLTQTIARHCGRGEPVLDDYRAVALAAFRDNERLRWALRRIADQYSDKMRGYPEAEADQMARNDLAEIAREALEGTAVQPCACGRKVGEPHRVDCGHSSREGGDTVQPADGVLHFAADPNEPVVRVTVLTDKSRVSRGPYGSDVEITKEKLLAMGIAERPSET